MTKADTRHGPGLTERAPEMALDPDRGQDKGPRLAFLLANWYSGATILTLLLDRHPQLTTNGEAFFGLGADQDTLCSCGAPIRRCPVFLSAGHHLLSGNRFDTARFRVIPRFSSIPLLDRVAASPRLAGPVRDVTLAMLPGVRKRINSFVHDHRRFMTRASRAAGAELYLDGTKNIRRAELFLEHSAPGSVPVLHMVRDPRGFAKSMLTEPTEQWRKPDTRMAARRWMRYLEAIDRLRESHPAAPFLEVRYEDLCHDPAGTLESIQRFLDVDCVDLLRLPKTQHHILGNRIRHTFEGPVVEDRSWTRSLSAKQVFEIEACCRSRMWSLRYTTNA